MKQKVGRYTILETLGEGGMGVVFVGYDETLERRVAIKKLRHSGDASARARLLREAKVAASVNHPNVGHVYEVGEESGELYIAMELLEGEGLDKRLQRGALPTEESGRVALGILDALTALHGKGIVHRDVKPSNVFLTGEGVKLLDFGLARALEPLPTASLELTQPGVAVGTPRYMSPEQWLGNEAVPASDLFSTGVVFYETLTGSFPFTGATLTEVRESVLRDPPPALGGGASVLALDRVLQQALEKRPSDRFPSAEDMAKEIRSAMRTSSSQAVEVKTLTRFLAMPFKVLRPDPETDFLAVSLPDTVTGSLSGLDSLVVRSSRVAEKFTGGSLDLRAVAREADVNAVLTGTLMRVGDRVRVTVELLEAPSGTVLASRSVQAPLDDLFQLQDQIAQEIVSALSIKLTRADAGRLDPKTPASPVAYERFLRANQVGMKIGFAPSWLQARDLYRSCVEEDPGFAPAWACLGRIYRVISKFGYGEPEENLHLSREAFARAFEIDPDLPLAHNYVTYLEVEDGRSVDAMVRLLDRAREHPSDQHLFAGLVVACRFCGLLEASVAADRRARRLDPTIRTSVQFTHFLMGNYEQAIEADREAPFIVRILSLFRLGKEEEAIQSIRKVLASLEGGENPAISITLAMYEGRREDCSKEIASLDRSGFRDPEGRFFIARAACNAGDLDAALRLIGRSVDAGFHPAAMIARDPWLKPLHARVEFLKILQLAEEKNREAALAFSKAGGERLLGVEPR